MSKRLGHRLAKLDKVLEEHELQRATRELGNKGRRGWVVVYVQPDETEQQARTRTFGTTEQWVSELTPKARQRLLVIVVTRAPAETLSA